MIEPKIYHDATNATNRLMEEFDALTNVPSQRIYTFYAAFKPISKKETVTLERRLRQRLEQSPDIVEIQAVYFVNTRGGEQGVAGYAYDQPTTIVQVRVERAPIVLPLPSD